MPSALKTLCKISVGIFFIYFAFWAWQVYDVFIGDTRKPNRYLIPQGYIGMVRVTYGKKGAPALPIENGYLLFKIPTSGTLKTSSKMQDGWAQDEFFYYAGEGRQPLDSDSDLPSCMVQMNLFERFFIGSKQQLRKAESYAMGAIPDGPLNPFTLKPLSTPKKR